jgi:hypothetical protein
MKSFLWTLLIIVAFGLFSVWIGYDEARKKYQSKEWSVFEDSSGKCYKHRDVKAIVCFPKR